MSKPVHPVDEMLPPGRLFTLGLQHVLVMYAGAIAVPLIIGRVLRLAPSDVAFLISADLFVCGIVSIIQSIGITRWVGVRLPVMMGVSFASVGPMIGIAIAHPGVEGARMMFGAIMGAGLIAFLLAPVISKLLRFFPPVVTGTIILIIGISLMKIGISWIFGLPVGPTAPKMVDPNNAAWLDAAAKAAEAAGLGAMPHSLHIAPTLDNPTYASLSHIAVSAAVLVVIMVIARYARGFIQNIAVLLGIIFGGILVGLLGMMSFNAVGQAGWFKLVPPLHFGMPIFDPVAIITFVLVMIVIMIESMGMFLALGEMTDTEVTPRRLAAGLRTDGLGSMIGGLFNTFPYSSFSQNVGLVGVTGVRSRYVTAMGGAIMIVLGLIPKMGALVESLPTEVLGGAGLVMFGMVAATGIRILSRVDFTHSRNNLFIVAVSVGFGMIPLVAPDFKMWMPHEIHPLIDSGILLATISSVLLNFLFNGASGSERDLRESASAAEA